ncbi:hypothetical protein FB459_3024 [Yimella lutea]|uniref:Phosphotransferase family enzyme n=1 Tax=Yimella lutea TaxID=587872 RepID=A0A542EJH0_9MICO|nr:hypothetical protein [Yimella lutea]TQJ15469.1 hypothetical protein FB459_3024 [Yimella lutea]
MPVPARDLSWVVDGWAASRFEPGTRALTDLPPTRAAGAVFHAELARAGLTWTPVSDDRWQVAERIAFGNEPVPDDAPPLVHALADERDDTDLGPDQFVHGDLAGNLLLDADGAPVVIDVAPYWRPALWAEAVWVLDSVMWLGANAGRWRSLLPAQAGRRWCGRRCSGCSVTAQRMFPGSRKCWAFEGSSQTRV